MNTLVPKFLISLGCAVIFFIFYFNKHKFLTFAKGKETILFILSLLIFRFLPVYLIFLVLNFDATSDVEMFYTWAKNAKDGYFVYRDFKAPYAPLFPYITAIPLFFYDNINSILLQMVVIESIILLLTYHFYSKIHSKVQALYISILYLSLPASFVLSVISGQEDIWMWGIIILTLYFFQKNRDAFWVGVILGIGMIVTKVIFVFSLPIAFILLDKKIRFLIGLALVGIPTLGVLIYFGGDSFLLPIQEANNPRTPNIWSILNPFLDIYNTIGIKILNFIGLVTNILLIIYFSLFAKKRNISFTDAFPLVWMLSTCWLMFIQQSSLSNYCFIFLMPFMFIFNGKSKKLMIVTILFNIACTVQPPIWWGQKMPIFTGIKDILIPINLLEYGLEIFIVGCIIYFCKTIISTLYSKIGPNGAT